MVILAAGGRDQELVLFYAVAVFLSFLSGLVAMMKYSRGAGDHYRTAVNLFGAAVVAFTIVVNIRRGYPIFSLLTAGLIASVLYILWVRAGRPKGVSQAGVKAAEETT